MVYLWHFLPRWFIAIYFFSCAALKLCHLLSIHHCSVHWISNFTLPEILLRAKLETGLTQSPCLSLCFQIFTHTAIVNLKSLFLLSALPEGRYKSLIKTLQKRRGNIYHRMKSPQLHFHLFPHLLYDTKNIGPFLCLKNRVNLLSKTLNHTICYLQWNPNTTMKIWALGANSIKFVRNKKKIKEEKRNASLHSNRPDPLCFYHIVYFLLAVLFSVPLS